MTLAGIEGVDSPHAMCNDSGDWFYPDNADDADHFMREHDARWVHGAPDWYAAEKSDLR